MSAIFFSFMFFTILFFSAKKTTNLMPLLIVLEVLGLLVFLKISFLLGVSPKSIIVLFFLVAAASESVLGLVLFVLLSRSFGKDYLKFLLVNKF